MSVHTVANLAYQLDGDPVLLRELAQDAARLSLVECRTKDNEPLDVARILGSDWQVCQDLSSAARAGSVHAVRRDSDVELRGTRLVLASPAGRNVQARYLRVVRAVDNGRLDRTGILHVALPATGRQDEGFRRAQTFVRTSRRERERRPLMRWQLVGDVNTPIERMRRLLDAPHAAGQGVVGAWWSTGWGDRDPQTRAARFTDHHVLTLTS